MSMDGTNNVDTPIAEQMLPQSKVNEVVGREKAATERRVRQELEQKHQQELESLRGQQPHGGFNMDEIVSKAAEQAAEKARAEMQQQHQEEMLERQKQEYLQYLDMVSGNYINKTKVGPSIYEDFEQVVADFEPKEFKNFLFAAHDMEELPDIIYELSKNPDKLDRIDSLAGKSMKMAKKELNRLAESIKANKAAKQSNVAINPPLQSIKPSTAAGVGDNGKLSLKDLKSVSWLKG